MYTTPQHDHAFYLHEPSSTIRPDHKSSFILESWQGFHCRGKGSIPGHVIDVSKGKTANRFAGVQTSSPTLIELPPQPGNSTLSPGLTCVGSILPSLLGAPGPTAITVASGRGLLVADVGKKMPDAVFCAHVMRVCDVVQHSKNLTVSGLKRWTRIRSRRGTKDLMDLNVAWAA